MFNWIRGYFTEAGRRAAWNLGWLLLATVLAQAFALASTLLIVDAIAPGEFGILTFALTVQGLAFLVGSDAGRSVVVRDLAESTDRAKETLSAYFLIAGGLSAGVAIVGVVVAFVAATSPTEPLVVSLLLFGNIAASVSPVPAFDAEHRQAATAATRAFGEGLVLACLVALTLSGWLGITTATAVLAGKWCLESALLFALLPSRFRGLHRPEIRRLKAMVVEWSWLAWSAVCARIPLTGGVIFVRLLTSNEEAAVQGLSQSIAMAVAVLAMMLVRVLQPHVAGPYGLRGDFVWRATVVCGTLGAMLATTVWLITRWFVPGWLPAAYHPIVDHVGPMLVAAVITSWNWLVIQYLLRLRAERIGAAIQCLAVLAFVLVCFRTVEIDPYGAASWTALGTTATTFLLLLSAGLIVSKVRQNGRLQVESTGGK